MKDKNIIAESYTLYTEDNIWLGQVILTSNNTFASVTDWGNFSYTWLAIGDRTFKDFLMSIKEDYFGDKMYTGMSFICHTEKVRQACRLFAKNILPALQKALKEEAEDSKIVALQKRG